MISIAIDGPSGAGKSSIAKKIAKELSFIYVDTGAMYRTIGLFAISEGFDIENETQITKMLPDIKIEIKYIDNEQKMFLNNEDVSKLIRTEAVSMAAAKVSAYNCVRQFLLDTQRDMANKTNVIMDGRDIGTVILPNASLKLFLTASPEERAKRRHKEYLLKGIETKYEDILEDINKRDYADTHREISPLKQAEGAILIDTSNLDFEKSVSTMLSVIKRELNL